MAFQGWYCLLPCQIITAIAIGLNILELSCLHRRVIEWPSTRIFLISLGYADLLVSSSSFVWFAVYISTRKKEANEVNSLLNGVDLSIILFSIISSIASVWLITIDRLICVIRPVTYRSLASPSWAKRITVFAWICSCLLTLILMSLGFFFNKYYVIRYCLATGLLLTSICMVAAYSIIIRTVRKTNRLTRDPTNRDSMSEMQRMRQVRREKTEDHLIMMSVIIVTAFISCSSPYTIFAFFEARYEGPFCSDEPTFKTTALTILFFNMVLDPCVYLFYRLSPAKCLKAFLCKKEVRAAPQHFRERALTYHARVEEESSTGVLL
uniref:Biogenic amine-like GPCR n=1 Tax=Tripedalia cystophora TaxID=6141 RepID=A0A481ZLQ8_TRICY|nr:biogenic amine-like GPCR [Tripedalia cystophora]